MFKPNTQEESVLTDEIKLKELLEKLEDSSSRENAVKELLTWGSENPVVADKLYLAQFSKEGQAHIAIYRVLAAIGDRIFKSDGAAVIPGNIIKAMEGGAKKSRQWVSDEVHNLSIDALTRWGLEIPKIIEQPVLICHVCGKKITEERIKRCFLLRCNRNVCHEHAVILKNPSGFDNWFCSKKHYQEATHNPTLMM